MPCGSGKKKIQVQKVVIPKGMINPGETTIIEIPSCLQRQPIVVAKRKVTQDLQNDSDFYTATITNESRCNTNQSCSAGIAMDYNVQNPKQHQPYYTNSSNDYTQFREEKGASSTVVGGGSANNTATFKASTELDKTEQMEREQFLKDLSDFQKARRKLIANASFLTNRDSIMGGRKC